MIRPDPIFEGVNEEEFIRLCDVTESYGTDTDGVKINELWQANANWRCSKHRFIKDKNGKIVPLVLNLAQRKVRALIRYCREHGIAVRIIIAKSRKQGISTDIAEEFYSEVIVLQKDALVIAHDKDTANWIYGIYARFYQYDDLPKPEPFSGGKVGTREMRFAGHDGHISVATARNEFAGTGRTPQLIHETEGSKWENGAETLTALAQCIGDGPETAVVKESTFNGIEECFLPFWKGAVENCKVTFTEDERGELQAHVEVTNHTEWNGYLPLFISVLDDADARRPFLDARDRERFSQTIDTNEEFLMRQYSATLEFLNWRRHTIKNKCRGNVDIFNQEYPVTWQLAIRASGRPRFDTSKLDCSPIEPGQVGRLEYGSGWDHKIVWCPDKGELLTVFRHPVPHHTYLIGCDTGEDSDFEDVSAEMEERLDKTAIQVFDLDNGDEQVAVYHGIRKPEEVYTPLNMIARYYNEAFVVIERNAAGSVACIEMQRGYDNGLLYHTDDWAEDGRRRAHSVGHKTRLESRERILGKLADAISDRTILLHHGPTVDELRNFVFRRRKKSLREKAQAAAGWHDDLTMACALAREGRNRALQVFETRKKMTHRAGVGVAAAQINATAVINKMIRLGRCASTGY